MGFLVGMILGAVLWHYGKDIALDMWKAQDESPAPKQAQEQAAKEKPRAKVDEVMVRYVHEKHGVGYLTLGTMQAGKMEHYSVRVGDAAKFKTLDGALNAAKELLSDYAGYFDVIDTQGTIWFQRPAKGEATSFGDKIGDAMLKGYGL